MSDLRRRVLSGLGVEPHDSSDSDSTPTTSREQSPAPSRNVSDSKSAPQADDKEYKIIPTAHFDKLTSIKKQSKGARRRAFWVFALGGLCGILAAGYFASNNGGLDGMLEAAGLGDLKIDSLFDVLPAGLIKDVQDLQKQEKKTVDYDSFAIGLAARSQGIEAHYPVIMIPGVISTGLESWGVEEQSRPYFRKRLWGSWTMMRAMVLDMKSWKRHIMLDESTGLDPAGIKLRAAQGFDAADFFITGYWIWNKILENLATIGYDPNNAFTAAYDWRLSYGNLEIRDKYFTRLKSHIEVGNRLSGRKIVLLSHSMGSQVLFYFFHWVESAKHGKGGPSWVNDHIAAWINISGCMLGAVKGVPAVLSGEMRDTVQLNAFAVYGLEKFLSRKERGEIFRAMPGISSMLPMGGEAVWGDLEGAPDDAQGQNFTFGSFLNFKETNSSRTPGNLTAAQALPYLYEHTEEWYVRNVKRSYSHGVAHTKKEVDENEFDEAKWINPLETRLPYAPDMKIFCFYGVGKPTERAYFYREDETTNKSSVIIDSTVSTPDGTIDHGVLMGAGDGTVNLLSTGYMCTHAWPHIRRYNPANISVTTHEMPHEPDRFSPRGGPNTGDHVDILGRAGLNDFILRIAGGRGELVGERVVSDIRRYAERVKIYDEEPAEEEGFGAKVGRMAHHVEKMASSVLGGEG